MILICVPYKVKTQYVQMSNIKDTSIKCRVSPWCGFWYAISGYYIEWTPCDKMYTGKGLLVSVLMYAEWLFQGKLFCSKFPEKPWEETNLLCHRPIFNSDSPMPLCTWSLWKEIKYILQCWKNNGLKSLTAIVLV